VRVWKISAFSQTMEAAMKEHKATINAIAILRDDTECISASDDGSCILWDLQRHVRRNIVSSPTYFKSAAYYVDESQLLTTGSDKKITYWDAVECGAIRELEGSKTGGIDAVDISTDGQLFVTGGGDKMIKVWDYDAGSVLKLGIGHSCNVTKVKFSPDGQRIVSVGEEGAIMIWKVGDLHSHASAE